MQKNQNKVTNKKDVNQLIDKLATFNSIRER